MFSLVSTQSIQYKFFKTILVCFIRELFFIIKIVLLSEFTINTMHNSFLNIVIQVLSTGIIVTSGKQKWLRVASV